MRLVILMGASGSGKTAIAEAIEIGHPGLADVLHFDSIGVPSAEDMLARWGSGEAWQRAMTIWWMARIAGSAARTVLFEGQMRLAFLTEGLAAAGLAQAHPILVDCDDETRTRRLIERRRQPELADARMMSWAAHLRQEAQEAGCEIFDTSHIALGASVLHVRSRLIGHVLDR